MNKNIIGGTFIFLLLSFLIVLSAYCLEIETKEDRKHAANHLSETIEFVELEKKVSALALEKYKYEAFNPVPAPPIEIEIERPKTVDTKCVESVLEDDNGLIMPEIMDKIKAFEGFYSKAYWDKGGCWAIGYGFTSHIIKINGRSVMSRDEADILLEKLVRERYLPLVRRTVKVPLSGYQVGSLVSLIHNIGEDAFKKSSLLYFLNKGEYLKAAREFPEWNKAGGTVLPELHKRRNAEMKIFLTACKI